MPMASSCGWITTSRFTRSERKFSTQTARPDRAYSRVMNRRELLERCAAAGMLLGVSDIGRLSRAWAATGRRPTPACELGPFYKRNTPSQSKLRSDRDPGMPLALAGAVYDTRGDLLSTATVELWHANATGHYDVSGDRFRATLKVGEKARYAVDTVIPGHYSGRVSQHVHYLVRAPGYRPLVTQLYFATDPVFGGEPAKNFTRDPLVTSAELVRPVTISGDPDRPIANVSFDLVLERA